MHSPLKRPTSALLHTLHMQCKWSPLPVGSLIAHSIEGEHSFPVLWPLGRQQAYSGHSAVATSLTTCSAICIRNQSMGCYRFSNPGGMEGWVGLVGWLTVDASPQSGHSLVQDRKRSPANTSILSIYMQVWHKITQTQRRINLKVI